jgi:hypothetical protein
MIKISKHITLAEAIKSETAAKLKLDNTPTAEHLEAMKALAEAVFEPLRKHFGKPIGISSFYRSPEINKHINKGKGGSSTSQHAVGEAMDIDAKIYNNGITNAQIFHFIKNNLDFDQLIWEFGTDKEPQWVHVSYTKKRKNKKQILKAIKVNSETKYLPYK